MRAEYAEVEATHTVIIDGKQMAAATIDKVKYAGGGWRRLTPMAPPCIRTHRYFVLPIFVVAALGASQRTSPLKSRKLAAVHRPAVI